MAKTLKTINKNAEKIAALRAEHAIAAQAAAVIKERIDAMEDAQMRDMLEAGVDQIKTEHGMHSITRREVGVVIDWADFDAWVIKNKAPDMYQRRMNLSAWRERRDAGIEVPGVVAETVVGLQWRGAK